MPGVPLIECEDPDLDRCLFVLEEEERVSREIYYMKCARMDGFRRKDWCKPTVTLATTDKLRDRRV